MKAASRLILTPEERVAHVREAALLAVDSYGCHTPSDVIRVNGSSATDAYRAIVLIYRQLVGAGGLDGGAIGKDWITPSASARAYAEAVNTDMLRLTRLAERLRWDALSSGADVRLLPTPPTWVPRSAANWRAHIWYRVVHDLRLLEEPVQMKLYESTHGAVLNIQRLREEGPCHNDDEDEAAFGHDAAEANPSDARLL